MIQQRYYIYEHYFGLFDSKTLLGATDSLEKAVTIVERLTASCDNACYCYDFKKVMETLDACLDSVMIGNGFDGDLVILDCLDYAEYQRKLAYKEKQLKRRK